MRKTILLHLVVMILSSCNNGKKSADCSNFVTGRFALHGKHTGHNYFIERNGQEQTEYDQTDGSITKLKIKWLDPCEYELRFVSRQKSPQDTVEYFDYGALKVKIIKAENDYCIIRSKSEEYDVTSTDTLWIEKATRP